MVLKEGVLLELRRYQFQTMPGFLIGHEAEVAAAVKSTYHSWLYNVVAVVWPSAAKIGDHSQSVAAWRGSASQWS